MQRTRHNIAKNALLWGTMATLGWAMSGCASGVISLGNATVFGQPIEYIQIGSKGETGPKLVVIEGFTKDHTGVRKVSAYSASGNSLTGQILGGSAAAALAAGGNVGAAAMRRPNSTSVNVEGTSGSASDSSSLAVSATSQQQEQSQAASGGCPGNSCGQGHNGHE